ncbi:MAG: UDP-glucuronic acid decarboxylase family protein [Anaerolineales bacterium]
MHVLVTGAAGFLGSHLCERLLAEGHRVVGLDNLITGDLENIAHLRRDPNFTFLRHDVTEPLPDLGPVEAVLHFASPASPNLNSPFGYPNLPIETLRAGSVGTLNCLELCLAHSARFLLASTSEVYGDPLVHPQHEDYWGHVNPIGPRSMYDEAKRFAEAATMAYHRKYGLSTRIVRIFNTYGPRMRLDDGRVVPNFIRQALEGHPLTIYGDGSHTRSFCYVDDLIEGIYRLLLSDVCDPINLGSPQETSILEFAHLINRLTGNQAGLIFQPENRLGDDPHRRQPDIQRARQHLGWEPRIDLAEGLRRTIPYVKQKLGLS